MNDTAPLSMPSLLEHAAWVNQLAHRLVTDPELARDVAQEAWRSALERPPGDTRNLKAWWSRVVHHSVLRLRRAELRREAREARVPTAGPEDSTAELVERAELQRDLVDRVLALSPPLREALLLRFFEHLPPRDIAHRLDVPVNTVRTRLQRGLVQLRQQLEREHPGRGAWALALLPLARAHAAHPEAAVALAHGARAEGVIASATGVGTGLSGGLLLAGAAVLLSALGLGAWWGLESSAEPESPRIETATAPPPTSSVPRTSPSPPPSEVERASLPNETGARPAPPAGTPEDSADGTAAPPLRALLLDADGHPLPGMRWRTDFQAELRRTDHAGRLELSSAALRTVELQEPGWMLLGGGAPLRPIHDEQLHLVAERSRPLSGVVLDPAGRGIPKVLLEVRSSVQDLPGSPYVLRSVSAYRPPPQTRSDENGRFELSEAPRTPGTRLRVFARGYESRSLLLGDENVLRLSLAPLAPAPRRALRGILQDGRAQPLAHALVTHARQRVRSDAEGFFTLECDESEISLPLFLMGEGRAPLRVEDARWESPADARAQPPQRFVLHEAAATLRGRVLDAEGQPLAGVQVELLDGTELGRGFQSAEAAGANRKKPALTDEEGCFALPGLAPRPYRLRLWKHPWTFVSTALLPGPETHVLSRPTDLLVRDLRGRVVDETGRGVEGAQIYAGFHTLRLSHGGGTYELVAEHVTRASGAFHLERAPRQGWVSCSAPGFADLLLPLEDLDLQDELVLRPLPRLRFVLEARELESVRALDAAGRAVLLRAAWPLDDVVAERITSPDGHWPVIEVLGTARQLLLEFEDGHLERQPVPREPGRVARLRAGR